MNLIPDQLEVQTEDTDPQTELAAMQVIVDVLEPLDIGTIKRVLRWVVDRFEEKAKEPVT